MKMGCGNLVGIIGFTNILEDKTLVIKLDMEKRTISRCERLNVMRNFTIYALEKGQVNPDSLRPLQSMLITIPSCMRNVSVSIRTPAVSIHEPMY